MKRLSEDEILYRLKKSTEITGYQYTLIDDKNKIKVYCPIHNYEKLQNKNYAFQGRKISCCNTYSPLRKEDIDNGIKRIQKENLSCDISINGKYNGGNTLIRVFCNIHKHERIIKYTSLMHKITEFACNKCSHEKYNRNFEFDKNVWIERAKKVHGNKYDYSLMEDHGIKRTIICKEHGKFIQSIRNHVYYANGCPKCVEPYNISSYEHRLHEWFEELGFEHNKDFITNTRSVIYPNELDFYFPELEVAIEFNGDYWHSDIKKDKLYHQNKCIECRENNINLIMIYQHDWEKKKKIIKNRLKSVLGLSNRIYARNTEGKSITYNDAKIFCEKHHIQGMNMSSYNYGLYYNNEIVAVMTFGKSRFTDHDFEMMRYCSIGNVIGGASKLLKMFLRENECKSIVSYADFDWSNGNLYEKLGFSEDKISKPSYVWVKGSIIKSRYQTQMKDENIIMRKGGFLKIYKSGSIRYSRYF